MERPCTRTSPRERGQHEADRTFQGRQTVEQACEPGAAPVVPVDEGPAGGVPHQHVVAEPADAVTVGWPGSPKQAVATKHEPPEGV